jgi:hypothetical protein
MAVPEGCVGPISSKPITRGINAERVQMRVKGANQISIMLIAAASLSGLATSKAQSQMAEWPPVDPGEVQASVTFTPEWASTLRGLQRFDQLQSAAGARGHIGSTEIQSETPRVVYNWVDIAHTGRMRAFLYENKAFAVIITPADGLGEIVLNSFGAFVCPMCSPPVNACGLRPSWVPHDLHWDDFDCPRTITGPQSLYSHDRG